MSNSSASKKTALKSRRECGIVMASYETPPAAVTLDIDDTPDVVHGHQQLAVFNAHGACPWTQPEG